VLTALLRLAPELAVATCPQCGGPIRYFVGRYGPFSTCERRSCKKSTSVSREQLAALAQAMEPPCSVCSSVLQPASGQHGPYLRCPKCDRSESWKHLRQRLVEMKKDG